MEASHVETVWHHIQSKKESYVIPLFSHLNQFFLRLLK